MRKRIIATILSGVVILYTGCGYTTDNDTTTAKEDITTEEITTTQEITTTEKITENNETTTKEFDYSKIVDNFEDFDINASRINVPEDKIIEGYDFSEDVFIGDSRTEGLTAYAVLTTSTVLATRGLMASSALTNKFIDMGNNQKGTIIDYLRKHRFRKAYIMLGLNELGCVVDTYISSYKTLIDEIREIDPNMEIYILPVIPMVEERTDEVYNNEIIATFNKEIKKMCDEMKLPLINISAALVNEEGTLPEEFSRDGIHLNTKGLTRMVNYLILATQN